MWSLPQIPIFLMPVTYSGSFQLHSTAWLKIRAMNLTTHCARFMKRTLVSWQISYSIARLRLKMNGTKSWHISKGGELPVLHKLAEHFLICDHWFSSVPGPTWPNRFFVHSGTSLGHVDMPNGFFHPGIHLYDQPTVYQRLSEKGISWKIYFGDVPQSLVLIHQLMHPKGYHHHDRFFEDAAGPEAGFPQYSFIEPYYFGAKQSDQHPPTDVRHGEALIASVYNAIRSNDQLWNSTLFVLLYDEHGGFYDHVT